MYDYKANICNTLLFIAQILILHNQIYYLKDANNNSGYSTLAQASNNNISRPVVAAVTLDIACK